MYGNPYNEMASETSLLNSTTSASNFGSNHESYTKSVARGRNPKSLPRNSELWYHTKNSNDRRDRIAKGHQFWDVVDHSASTTGYEESIRMPSSSLYSEGSFRQSHSQDQNRNRRKDNSDEKAIKNDSTSVTGAGRKNSNNFKTLNNARFDVKVSCGKILMLISTSMMLSYMMSA